MTRDQTLEREEWIHILPQIQITGDGITTNLQLWDTRHSFSTPHSFEGILTFLYGIEKDNGLDLYLDDSILIQIKNRIDGTHRT